jgi:hypothetical protein
MITTRIAKARLKDGQLIVELQGHDKDTERHTVVKCAQDKLHAELMEAFAALSPGVREILELPSNAWTDGLCFRESIRVTGVSWSLSETTGVEGACLVFQVDLEGATSPFNGVTPHLPFGQYTEDGNAPVMPDGVQVRLDELRRQVEAFLDGKRADQGDLFERAELRFGIPAETLRHAAT